jgi:hypothetical protein
MSITVIGCGIVFGLAYVAYPDGTKYLLISVITIRGTTWLAKKIVSSINVDYGQIVNFAGWCLAGISIIGIIKNAMDGVEPVMSVFKKIGDGIEGIGIYMDKFAEVIEKITFWN